MSQDDEASRNVGGQQGTGELAVTFGVALLVRAVTALTVDDPGYLDGHAYLHGAQRLARGLGLTEDFVWQYLDTSPVARGLPHPAALHWMPLTTWLGALGLRLHDGGAFAPFVVLGAVVPLLAVVIARRLGAPFALRVQAAVLALFLGPYFARWVVTEPCAPFAVATAVAFLAVTPQRWPGLVVAGVAAAVAHLTRADGFLVLAALLVTIGTRGPSRLGALALVLASYGFTMVPWWLRQWGIADHGGAIGLRTALLVGYDDLFAYDESPSWARFWGQGLGAVMSSRVRALTFNVGEVLGAFQGVLVPLAALGFGTVPRERRRVLTPLAVYAVLLMFTMTVVIPDLARFGTLYRSASALVPWVAALAPLGAREVARRYAAFRGHAVDRAEVLLPVLLTGALALAGVAYHLRELGWIAVAGEEPWNRRLDPYREVAALLARDGGEGSPRHPVLTTNPPAFTLATGRPSVMAPSDGPAAAVHCADHYGARYLVLESNLPWALSAWRTGAPLPGFSPVGEVHDATGQAVRLYERTP